MPLYEYQCPQCGRFELIQKFSDPPLTACPTCNAEVHKLLSAPAIQFKGTGWYVTDYARKSSSEGGGKSSSTSDASKSSDSAASSSAPASGSAATSGDTSSK